MSLKMLMDVLRYDPHTGLFHWKIERNSYAGKIHPGDIAGTDKDGYTSIVYTDPSGKRHRWRSHRLAWWFMTGRKPGKLDIGHADGDRSNNRWTNLAEVTRTKNMLNLNDGLRSNNKSGHRGVSWRTHRSGRGCWHARIKINGKVILLGDYAELEDAVRARKRAEKEYL